MPWTITTCPGVGETTDWFDCGVGVWCVFQWVVDLLLLKNFDYFIELSYKIQSKSVSNSSFITI